MSHTDVLTVAQVAGLLGVHPSRVRQWIAEGRLRATKHGRDWLVRRRDARRPAMRPRGRPQTPR